MDPPPVAFRWAPRRGWSEVEPRFSLLHELPAGFLAGFGLAVKLLRDRRGSANVAQAQDFNFEVAAFGLDRQQIANADHARRASRLLVRFDAVQLTGLRGEGARLEEACRPQPFVETRACHKSSVLRASIERKQ